MGVRKSYEQLPKPNNQPGLGRCSFQCFSVGHRWLVGSVGSYTPFNMLLPKGNLTHPKCSGVSSVLQVDSPNDLYWLYCPNVWLSWKAFINHLSEERSQHFSPGKSGFEQKLTRGYERKPSSRHDPQNRWMAHIFVIRREKSISVSGNAIQSLFSSFFAPLQQ